MSAHTPGPLEALRELAEALDAYMAHPADATASWRAADARFRAARSSAKDALAVAACEACDGAGIVFTHADDCYDDLCALNGDQHSCAGQVVACDCASALTKAGSAS